MTLVGDTTTARSECSGATADNRGAITPTSDTRNIAMSVGVRFADSGASTLHVDWHAAIATTSMKPDAHLTKA